MALPHLERRDISCGGETRATREHLGLGPGEVILFMRPEHLISSTLVTRAAEEYFTQQILSCSATLEDFERNNKEINTHLQFFDRERIAKTLAPVIDEYRGFLHSLVSAAGPRKIKLLSTRSLSLYKMNDLTLL